MAVAGERSHRMEAASGEGNGIKNSLMCLTAGRSFRVPLDILLGWVKGNPAGGKGLEVWGY